jgi:hypothetical protein
VDANEVQGKGWNPTARRVSGVCRDEFLVGTKHICLRCKRQRAAAVAAAASSGEAAVRAAERKHTYCFLSYDPRVTNLYLERFPFLALAMPAVVCTNRTAMTRELSQLIQSACVSGSTPSSVAKLLAELRALAFTLALLAYYSFQVSAP